MFKVVFVTIMPFLRTGLNYTYLIWVYFLYYIGAGYPSWYYPYIISTLLNYIPSECGGTGRCNVAGLKINVKLFLKV